MQKTTAEDLQKCREEADRYRLLAEQSTDMISRHSATSEWVYIDVNPAVERVLGYTVDEIIGTKGYDLFHPEDADNLIKRTESVHYRRGMYTNTYRYRHKDGHYIWLETTSRTIRDDQGTPVEIICVSRDVTEREMAQRAIRRLARVVEASSDLIMFCNHESMQLTYLNESAYRTLGSEKENLVIFYLDQIFDDEIFNTLVQDALSHAAQHGTWYGSIPLKMPENHQRIAEIREVIAHRNRTENMQVEYYSIIGRDITLKRKAEEQAKRQQLEMAHMSRLLSVGEMATGLAHEINQPLAAILNYCRGSLRRLEEGSNEANLPQIAHSMQLITKQAKRAADIVKRMRSFVKRTDYQRIEFSINESCIDVVGFLNQEATDHNITFNFELDPAEPKLLADKIQIEQVLLNLLRNAIEAYSDSQQTYRPVTITTQLKNGYIYISAQDDGNGISAEGLKTLFEPFITSKSTGLGMGLAISQTIIETHGGLLWAESDGNTGTQFQFKVPVRTS
ncbi:PAS domain-containing sensor histidine kinase [Neptunomonas antarctica]|uniref:histidine kinase n=1 Tax=Neptunomonas antarctica TaxID=619304 RepID=A0A1N7JX21_9GAMM|nr:PAS domain-containing sensor histidine kinase [Neptunomonas antarctica]SIS53867.1 two-component system, LuxR family, sensor kinase FixL [Neptunomonas antarctica]